MKKATRKPHFCYYSDNIFKSGNRLQDYNIISF